MIKNIELAENVLNDYYGTVIPRSILETIILSDEELIEEVQSGGIGDTCARELLSFGVTKHLRIRPWPIFGEGEEVFKDFIELYKQKIEEIGGHLILD